MVLELKVLIETVSWLWVFLSFFLVLFYSFGVYLRWFSLLGGGRIFMVPLVFCLMYPFVLLMRLWFINLKNYYYFSFFLVFLLVYDLIDFSF